jgi:hypothetical protein
MIKHYFSFTKLLAGILGQASGYALGQGNMLLVFHEG